MGHKQKDSDGNSNNGNVINHNSSNNYVYSDGKVISLIGISDTIVVDTKDALLISKKIRFKMLSILSLISRKITDEKLKSIIKNFAHGATMKLLQAVVNTKFVRL